MGLCSAFTVTSCTKSKAQHRVGDPRKFVEWMHELFSNQKKFKFYLQYLILALLCLTDTKILFSVFCT
jgi:hypothetical protein